MSSGGLNLDREWQRGLYGTCANSDLGTSWPAVLQLEEF